MWSKYELPPELQEEHVDALIIFSKDSEDDQGRAERLRDEILKLNFDNGNTGKAVFLDDAVPYVTSQIDRLDEAVKFATLVFVIYSRTLNNDSVILRNSQAVLWHTIEEKTRQKQRSFIPVIHGKQTSESLLVKSILPINTSLRNWKECLKKKIECSLGERIARTNEQEKRKQEFWRSSSHSDSSVASISNTTSSHPQIELSVLTVYNGNLNQVSTEDVGVNGNAVKGNEEFVDGNLNQVSTEDIGVSDYAVKGNEEFVDGRLSWHNRFASWLEENLISVVGVGGIAFFVLLLVYQSDNESDGLINFTEEL